MSGAERLVRQLEGLADDGVGGAKGAAVTWRARLTKSAIDRQGMKLLFDTVEKMERRKRMSRRRTR